ncbi:hypothetical protein ANAPRD1_00400 [Anaplasma phagocytophilum]|nr:hypothetical protein ANAPRD1_00400 [Anaplasma phagocytophilum]
MAVVRSVSLERKLLSYPTADYYTAALGSTSSRRYVLNILHFS